MAATVRDLQVRLVELGRIRMGEKGTRGEPRRLTHWRLTSASRTLLDAAAALYGGKTRPWAGAPDAGYWELYTEADELDVLIPPTLSAYSQSYEIWEAGGLVSRCDGTTELLTDEPCDHGDHADYQIVTRLNVMLPRVPGLGVWRTESHGWNAATTIPATMELLRLAGASTFVPAVLRIEAQSKKVRDEKGKPQTHRWGEPRLDLPNLTIGQLLADVEGRPSIAGGGAPLLALQRGAGAEEPIPVNRRERVARPVIETTDLPSDPSGRARPTFGAPVPLPGEDDDDPGPIDRTSLPPTSPADPVTGEVITAAEQPAAVAAESASADLCRDPSPYGDGLWCVLRPAHAGNHKASNRATWNPRS